MKTQTDKKKFNDREDLRWLSRTIRGTKRYILLLTLVRAILGMAGVAYAACLRRIVDGAVTGLPEEVVRGVALLVGLLLVQFLLGALTRYLNEFIHATVENKLKLRLLDRILDRDYAQVTAVHSGEWMNRLTTDTTIIAGSAVSFLPSLAGMISRMVSAVGMLLIWVPKLTVLLLAGGLLMIAATLWIRKILKRLNREIRESDGRLRVFLTERLGSLMILKAYQQESSAEAQASVLMDGHKAARMKKNHVSNFCNSGFTLAMYAALVVGAAYCGHRILLGTLSYGTFTAVIQLIGQLQSPIAGLTGFIPQYYAMLTSVERLREAEDFSQEQKSEAVDLQQFRGFGLRQVSYAYPDSTDGRGAVHDLTVEVKRGEYVAFAGPSGCGKSTALKLLLCLYRPDLGERYVMTDRGEAPLEQGWEQLFAYVPQGNQLMSGTIREVVSFAAPERMGDDDALWEALDIACAREFVALLPQGLDTQLGERGSGLSEGQMQRLAVARALFSGRPVLLLDEATSALDGESELRLLQNIRALTGKTVMIVTHRPAALDIVDQVITFSEKGCAVQRRG